MRFLFLPLLFGLASCSHTQTAPTPAPTGASTTVSSSSNAASKVRPPWTNAASTPSPGTVPDLTAPMDVAMVLCSSALNLAPCGVVTSGANDVMTCFAGCQTQIETVVAVMIEHAAQQCASAHPPDAGPRQCSLAFPPTAAIDLEVAGQACNRRCEEIVGNATLTRSP